MDKVFFIILILVIGVGLFMILRWRSKSTTSQVIQIFREHNAINVKNAKTIDELGLRTQTSSMESMLDRRDYKAYALGTLMKAEIIQMAEDGKLYLSEEKLLGSKFAKN